MWDLQDCRVWGHRAVHRPVSAVRQVRGRENQRTEVGVVQDIGNTRNRSRTRNPKPETRNPKPEGNPNFE